MKDFRLNDENAELMNIAINKTNVSGAAIANYLIKQTLNLFIAGFDEIEKALGEKATDSIKEVIEKDSRATVQIKTKKYKIEIKRGRK